MTSCFYQQKANRRAWCVRFMRGFKGGGGRESAPSLENSNLINSQCLISETDLGPDWKTKSSLASPSTLQKLSGSAHETGNGTNAPTHFEFQLVRPSVCQNY